MLSIAGGIILAFVFLFVIVPLAFEFRGALLKVALGLVAIGVMAFLAAIN